MCVNDNGMMLLEEDLTLLEEKDPVVVAERGLEGTSIGRVGGDIDWKRWIWMGIRRDVD